MESNKSDLNVAVLVFPFAADNTFDAANRIVNVVSRVVHQTILISGKFPKGMDWPDNVRLIDIDIRVHYVKDKKPRLLSALLWLSRLIRVQIKMALWVFRERNQLDAIMCTLGILYQLPILTAKLLGKKIIVSCFGNDALRAELNYGKNLLSSFISCLTRLQFSLSDKILVESFQLIEDNKLLMHQKSKLCNGALYIQDLSHFSAHNDHRRETNLIGFIGRLVVEKGILEFLHAIPLIQDIKTDLRYIVIGNGTLNREIAEILSVEPWVSCVEWINWVDHQTIPIYLNRVGLLVMPSHTEGLPNLVLEAMACETPILASGVGGIPDILVDGKTGFILEDRSPETISEAVIKTIEKPDLKEITGRARALIENNYSLDASVQRYRNIANSLSAK